LFQTKRIFQEPILFQGAIKLTANETGYEKLVDLRSDFASAVTKLDQGDILN